jgi:hypothetical protein
MNMKNLNNYTFHNKIKFNKKKYEELLENKQYSEMEKCFVPYYTEKLMILHSYYDIFKNKIPTISAIFIIINLISHTNTLPFLTIYILSKIISWFLNFKLKKHYFVFVLEVFSLENLKLEDRKK